MLEKTREFVNGLGSVRHSLKEAIVFESSGNLYSGSFNQNGATAAKEYERALVVYLNITIMPHVKKTYNKLLATDRINEMVIKASEAKVSVVRKAEGLLLEVDSADRIGRDYSKLFVEYVTAYLKDISKVYSEEGRQNEHGKYNRLLLRVERADDSEERVKAILREGKLLPEIKDERSNGAGYVSGTAGKEKFPIFVPSNW